MAITRAQQAKQMLQNGGMSLQDAKDMAPKGEFLAYINRKEADMLKKAGGSGIMTGAGIPSFTSDTGPGGGATDTGAGHTGDSIGGGNQAGGKRDTRREKGIKAQFTGPDGTTGNIGNLNPDGTRSRNPLAVSRRPRVFYDSFNPTTRNLDFMRDFRRKVNPLGPLTNVPGAIGFVSRAITPNPFGFGPPDMEFTNPTRNEEGEIPLWMQLGYSSEAEYNAAMARGLAPAVTEDPPVNLNRMAYRLMAEGGVAMDDEPRQAYGLGSIVKKAARAVKKVAKSDLGKAAIAAASIYYLGGGGNPFTAAGRSGFSFGNLPGAGLFKKGLPNLAKGQIGVDKFLNPIYNRAGQSALTKAGIGKAGLGILAASALPFFMGDEEEEEAELSPYLTESLDIEGIRANPRLAQGRAFRLQIAEGGSTEKKEPVAKKVMPLIDMDGKEKDYRETGGFVDMGRMEKADDVPARLSKNEFVFTADAVRNAGDGSVDKGAEVMYNMMKNLEAGGEVSEESQGLEGARKMFQTSQRLEEVL
jgi:hypothetical protein